MMTGSGRLVLGLVGLVLGAGVVACAGHEGSSKGGESDSSGANGPSDSGDSGDASDASEAALSKLRQRGLLSTGKVSDERAGVCRMQCFVGASCDGLARLACSGVEVPSVEACFDDCDTNSEGGFSCANGGELMPADWECDGVVDCSDGSDEAGWQEGPSFECSDGRESIPAAWVCDLGTDCWDGSDEAQGRA